MSESSDFDLDRRAEQPVDPGDLHVLGTLRSIFQASDPVPSGLAERSKFAMTVAALEAEVAEIMQINAETAGVRTAVYDRAATITFSSGQISAMITIEPLHGGTARLSGWIAEGPTSVEIRERARTQTTQTDSEGRFTFASVERGLVHLLLRRLDLPDSRPVITPALEI